MIDPEAITEYLDAETTQARIRTSILAALAALRAHKLSHGRSPQPDAQATVITACVLEALRPIVTPPPADEVSEDQQSADEQAAA